LLFKELSESSSKLDDLNRKPTVFMSKISNLNLITNLHNRFSWKCKHEFTS